MHRGSRLGLALLGMAALSGGVTTAYGLAASSGAPVQNSTEQSSAPKTTTMALPGKTRNAWELPAFSLTDLDGNVHSLDEWKGRVIMLNFWAALCAPCQYEIKDFVRYQDTYSERGLQIVGIGVDQERPLRNVSRTLGINYPVLVLDPANENGILADWGNEQQIIPYTVVIDSKGMITYIHRGQLNDEAFNNFVLPLLKPQG